MLFSSPVFLFGFLPLALLIYFLSPQKFKNITLLIISLIFYSWGEINYLFLIIFLVTINYLFAQLLQRYSLYKKWVLFLTIIINLSILAYFKYALFLLENIYKIVPHLNNYLNIPDNIVLPLGISFVTFHLISYLIDVYRKTIQPEKNIINFSLYIFLFPHLIAGPIVRYINIGKQVNKRQITINDFSYGIERFILGLGKKVLIANNLALVSDTIFNLFPHQLSPQIIWLGLICFSLQIYFDFSGYSDMAIGLARMFGFKFNENFNYPYISQSIQDFWRRWHISLSSWFRDYLYIPLGGSRKGNIHTVVNILIVFSLTGLWHGANWNFIFWGFYYGVILTIERIFLSSILKSAYLPIRYIYSLLIIMTGWLFFKVESLSYAFYLLKVMYGFEKSYTIYSINYFLNYEVIITLVFAILFSIPLKDIISQKILNPKIKQSIYPKLINILFLIFIFIYSSMQLASNTYNPFIYFRF